MENKNPLQQLWCACNKNDGCLNVTNLMAIIGLMYSYVIKYRESNGAFFHSNGCY